MPGVLHALAKPFFIWQIPLMSFQKNTVKNDPQLAKFRLGQIVRHRTFDFRGVIFDVDTEFNNTEEWYNSIPPDVRPRKDQPFYHLLAENEETEYVAYVSEQNLLVDDMGGPVRHPDVRDYFGGFDAKQKTYRLRTDRGH